MRRAAHALLFHPLPSPPIKRGISLFLPCPLLRAAAESLLLLLLLLLSLRATEAPVKVFEWMLGFHRAQLFLNALGCRETERKRCSGTPITTLPCKDLPYNPQKSQQHLPPSKCQEILSIFFVWWSDFSHRQTWGNEALFVTKIIWFYS